VGPSVVELVGLIVVVGTAAVTIVKVARLWTTRLQSPSADVTARLEALERNVEHLQQEQAETQERLDFAERLLTKAREERRIGS
jgi:FtsZ-binding cell division protein ZapB